MLKKSDLVRGLQHEFPDGIQRGLGLQGLSLSHVEPRVQGTLEVRDTEQLYVQHGLLVRPCS